jgi:hypothetical protein
MGWIKSEEGRKRRDKFDQEYREMMGDLYRHFKGGVYEVVCESKHSETLEEMVVYRNTESGETWVRPKKMFCGNRGNVKRFTKIVESEDE